MVSVTSAVAPITQRHDGRPWKKTARNREVAAGEDQEGPYRADRDQCEEGSGVPAEPDREDQQRRAEQDRGQAGARAEPVLRLQPAGAVTHRHRAEWA